MPGRLVHFEIPVQNADETVQFYSSVFGWEFSDSGMPGIDYRMTRTGPEQGGAIYPSQGGERGPVIYFDTEDIDRDVARIRELGGEAEDKQPIPGVGWFAHCKDPEGTEFSLFQSDESVTMPGATG